MKTGKINVATLAVGVLETCCYLVWREGGADCACIDPGGDVPDIIKKIRSLKLALAAILITHSHFDHIGGVGGLLQEFPQAEVLCHKVAGARMQTPEGNLGYLVGSTLRGPKPTRTLAGGEKFSAGGVEFEARFVPGHEPGHLAFYVEEGHLLFCGDVLFAGSVGRTDFPGCSHAELEQSLRGQILTLPDATKVYPGHGPATSIGRERKSNPFLEDL